VQRFRSDLSGVQRGAGPGLAGRTCCTGTVTGLTRDSSFAGWP